MLRAAALRGVALLTCRPQRKTLSSTAVQSQRPVHQWQKTVSRGSEPLVLMHMVEARLQRAAHCRSSASTCVALLR